MSKLIGYIIALIGLFILLLNTNILRNKIDILNSMPLAYMSIAGIAILVIGIVLLFFTKEKTRQVEEEVPIYKGKKIVGYRKE